MSDSSNLDAPRYIRNDSEPPYVDSLDDYWWVGPASARYREALATEDAAIQAALAADRGSRQGEAGAQMGRAGSRLWQTMISPRPERRTEAPRDACGGCIRGHRGATANAKDIL